MVRITRVLTAGLLAAGLSTPPSAIADDAAAVAAEHPLAAQTSIVDCAPGAPVVAPMGPVFYGSSHPLAHLGRVEKLPRTASVQGEGIGVPTESLPPLAIPPLGGPEAYWRPPAPGLPIGPPSIPALPKSACEKKSWWNCRLKCDRCYGRGCLHCISLFRDPAHHGAVGVHHGRAWRYVSGELHGFPFTHSDYQPRAAGASYNFGRWVPTRSFYYPYVPGAQAEIPYGFSPEPYYFPEAFYTSGHYSTTVAPQCD